jgi:serine/threonine protein kinase
MQDKERIGQYEIVGQIGKGGMATVYKAYHDRLDRHVAIKVLHNAFLQDSTFIARFEREARIVAKLEHSNIVPIYDYSEKDGSPYLVMKYVEGQTLKQRALKSEMTYADVINLMTPIASALDYAHLQGVLHRDLKPSNILVDTEGKPYLTDFGLARMAQVGESTISHDMMLGTPFYISPEQAQGVKDITNATDVYSFGIILYELLTGSVPFISDSAYAIVHGHIYKEVTPPSEMNSVLPVSVDAILLKALAKDPNERYQNATSLMKDLATALTADDSGVQQAASIPEITTRNNPNSVQPETVTPSSQPNVNSRNPDGTPRKPRVKVEADFDFNRENLEKMGERLSEWGTRMSDTVSEWFDEEAEEERKEARRRRKEAQLSPEERIRKRIQKRDGEFMGLIGHALSYLMVNIFLISFLGWQFWMIFVIGGWGIGMASHAYEYYTRYGPGAERRERQIQEELMRLENSTQQSKVKNAELNLDDEIGKQKVGVRLTEDGELTDSFIQESQDPKKRNYR